MKSRIMRKLFIGNLLIFVLSLILQFGFQTTLFEPFLVRTQKNRLIKSVENVQSCIEEKDKAEVRRLIHEEADRGIVLVALDKEMNQIYGQSFDQYQRCFTLENDQKERYTIVEDYLESISLQAIAVGDVVSIDGYLVDEQNALVIPSKVYRTKDGFVFGTDTFLFVNPSEPSEAIEADDQAAMESGVMVSSQPGIAVSEDTTDSNGVDGASQDESNLPRGFVLQSPYDSSDSNDQMGLGSGSLSGSLQDTTLLDKRLLIINGGERNGDSYPITISGTVVDIADVSKNDLLVQQGLIADEIERLSATTNRTVLTKHETMTEQLTTGTYLLCVSRLSQSGMMVIGAISLYSIQDMNHMMNTFHAWLFLLELGLITCAIYFFSRMISKPLVEMNGVALKIAHQDFSARVIVKTNDEIGTLGISINEISANLEKKIQQVNAINDRLQRDNQRQIALQERHKKLSLTFSHEMKTPLTILRGYIDGIQNRTNPKAQEEYYNIALRELNTASSLITQMLEIARMESPYFSPKMVLIDLWMVFYKVYDELKQVFSQKGMVVEFAASDEANTLADAELLERVVSNALTNAEKYSPQGSRIWVRIATVRDRHTFSVENENASIPTAEMEKIWQPFYRAEKSRANAASGTGLGLVIVSEILDAHGFPYGIQNTSRGVEFSFSCPAITSTIESEGEI